MKADGNRNNKRRSGEFANRWRTQASVFDECIAVLDSAVRAIDVHDALDDVKDSKSFKSRTNSALRQQLRIRTQCLMCRT